MTQNTLIQVQAIRADREKGRISEGSFSHETVFHSILDSGLPPEEKTAERLADEAQVLMMAGTLTTAWVLEVIMYWLIMQPDDLRKVKAELREAAPDPSQCPAVTDLRKLPYLTAVIKEGLRLSYGVSCRLARSDPDKNMHFVDATAGKTYIIPRGTPVGMTSVQIHHDEAIFPDARRFQPERWLGTSDEVHRLDKYLVSFSAGSRKCAGINLAWAELYICLGTLLRTWGSDVFREDGDVGTFALWRTNIGDVEIMSDHFLPCARKGTQGIRVVVER